MIYGYATNETTELIPAPLALAHKIARRYKDVRENKYLHYFEPDGKCQVSYLYENDIPVRIETIVISAQTKPGVSRDDYSKVIMEEILYPLIKDIDDVNVLINPTGEFIIGGPEADSGLTGRKIIVDTYGGFSHHGGGAFSGKDSSKVDRSAAYYARYVANSIVKAGLAKRCEVGVAYSIGVNQPVSLYLDTFNTGVLDDCALLYLVKCYFDFTPASIRKELDLDNVLFRNLSRFGHVGRTDLNLKWEQVEEKADELRKAYEKTKRTTYFLQIKTMVYSKNS